MRSQSEHNACGAVEVRLVAGSHGTQPACRRSSPVFAVVLTGVLMMVLAHVAAAKSLYVIAQILNAEQEMPIQAYDIGPDGTLTFQAEHLLPLYGAGAVGLALDSDSKHLFVTYESSNVIVVLDAVTLESVGTVTAQGARNLAGIVYDHDKKLLYCMDRTTPNLYAYQWDANSTGLTPVPGFPVVLQGSNAYGIALDELRDELYVGGPSPQVRVYSTESWKLNRTISVRRTAISVAVDPVRRYLYSGGAYPVSDNFYLERYDLVTDTIIEALVPHNGGIMGLGVDSSTGFVFASTGRNGEGGGDDLVVFDSTLMLLFRVPNIGDPTGLAVPDGHVSFNPLRLVKTLKAPVGQATTGDKGLPQVTVGEQLIYSLCFDHNNQPLTGVSLVDRLPPELDFVQATGDGTYGRYDPQFHTYTWSNPPLTGGPTTCLELICRVDPNTPAGTILTNWATIDAREVPPTTTEVAVVTVAAKVYRPLGVSKTVIAGVKGGSSTTLPSAQAGAEVTYRIAFDNKSNAYPVEHISIFDDLPDEVDFVRATGDRSYGHYEPLTHSYAWAYPRLAPGESNSVDLVVRLKKEATPNTTITNVATAKSDNTPEARTRADFKVAEYVFTPLTLEKTLVSGAVGQPDSRKRSYVSPGATLTYAICFRNPSTNRRVTDVSIADTLPPELEFVSAEGDRDFGSYDPDRRTYTWRSLSLEPGQERCLSLVVRVSEKVDPNTVITNVATISSGQTSATTVRAEAVVRPAAVEPPPVLYLKPDHIYRNNSKAKVELMAVVVLPEGIGKEAIDNTPLVLTPGDVPATGQQIFGTSRQGKILCFFDTAPILAATPGFYGQLTLKATGQLKDGRSFTGADTIWILKFGGP